MFEGKWKETAVREKMDHVEKRKLKQLMPNESQTLNITTSSTTTHDNATIQVLTTLPTAAAVNNKKEGSPRPTAQGHEKESHTLYDHHIQNNLTRKRFPWTEEVIYIFFRALTHVDLILEYKGVCWGGVLVARKSVWGRVGREGVKVTSTWY